MRFPDGSRFPSSRVTAVDVMGDLAVVELASAATATPVTIGDPTALGRGSEVFIIGYAGGTSIGGDQGVVDPTITRGLISRFRRWDAIGMTYVETDAVAIAGVSGGALVSTTGKVVAIPQFSDGDFAIASSATRAIQRVNALSGGGTLDGLRERTVRRQGGSQSFSVQLTATAPQPAYVVSARTGTTVTVTVTSTDDAYIGVVTGDGFFVDEADNTTTGSEQVTFRLDVDTPYLVVFGASGDDPQLTVTSTSPLALLPDPDDGTTIAVGSRVAGAIDHRLDVDLFTVDLAAGETVIVTLDSIAIDAALWITSFGFRTTILEFDDDSGGGLFGLSSEIRFTPDTTGRYLIIARGFLFETGGYFITVNREGSGGATAQPGAITAGAVPSSGFGLIVFGGGTNSQLTAAAGCPADRLLFYVPVGEEWIVFIPTAPDAVNAGWDEHFLGGIPPTTPLVAQCRAA